MQTVLFNSTIFGPVKSRRLGVSLGVNLMPSDGKLCSFDCLYCEAGFNAQGAGTSGLPSREAVKRQLRVKLEQMVAAGEPLDSITFSGNGEPTLHPQFKDIVHDVQLLRTRYYPQAAVTVLSNATMATRPAVMSALKSVDNNVLKLDSAVASTMRAINRPLNANVLPEGLIADLKSFGGRCIVQTMLVRGEHEGRVIDNTTAVEVEALIAAYLDIAPRYVQLYSIDRPSPATGLHAVPHDELERIAARIADAGIDVKVN